MSCGSIRGVIWLPTSQPRPDIVKIPRAEDRTLLGVCAKLSKREEGTKKKEDNYPQQCV